MAIEAYPGENSFEMFTPASVSQMDQLHAAFEHLDRRLEASTDYGRWQAQRGHDAVTLTLGDHTNDRGRYTMITHKVIIGKVLDGKRFVVYESVVPSEDGYTLTVEDYQIGQTAEDSHYAIYATKYDAVTGHAHPPEKGTATAATTLSRKAARTLTYDLDYIESTLTPQYSFWTRTARFIGRVLRQKTD